ncbi:MAG TPA: hypothetical protein VFW14_20250, partial [Gaiellales bacterium]|nr:hypothetical protein [Gaiellales bacterium]
ELPAARFDHLLVVAEAEAAAAKEQASRLRDRERALAETPDLPDVLSDLHERLLAPVKDAETTAALRAALRRVFSHFEVTTRPPRMIPVGPTPDALDDPQPPVDAAEAAAIADRVAEGLGVTVEEDGLPFKWESRWYLEPVLLDDVDLGLEVDRWAIVDPVAVERNNSYSARAASIALGRAPWEPEGQVPARYDGRMRILTWGARSS